MQIFWLYLAFLASALGGWGIHHTHCILGAMAGSLALLLGVHAFARLERLIIAEVDGSQV